MHELTDVKSEIDVNYLVFDELISPNYSMSFFSSSASNFVRLLVGSRHHFDLVKISLGEHGVSNSGDSTRILTLASGSSTGAISATEVRDYSKTTLTRFVLFLYDS